MKYQSIFVNNPSIVIFVSADKTDATFGSTFGGIISSTMISNAIRPFCIPLGYSILKT